MSCRPAGQASVPPYSMITITAPTDSPEQPTTTERRASKVYQIFPESPMESESESWSEDRPPKRDRLPSIVVDPTEVDEVESGELRWPPVAQGSVEEEDPFPEGNQSSGSSPERQLKKGVNGKEQGPGSPRKSSIGPNQAPLDLTRLTPPSSPTTPEAAPPSCLKN